MRTECQQKLKASVQSQRTVGIHNVIDKIHGLYYCGVLHYQVKLIGICNVCEFQAATLASLGTCSTITFSRHAVVRLLGADAHDWEK